jgi:hypothetical protein
LKKVRQYFIYADLFKQLDRDIPVRDKSAFSLLYCTTAYVMATAAIFCAMKRDVFCFVSS